MNENQADAKEASMDAAGAAFSHSKKNNKMPLGALLPAFFGKSLVAHCGTLHSLGLSHF